MMWKTRKTTDHAGEGALRGAIEAWREAADERLSAAARATILASAVRQGAEPEPLPSLFLPWARLAAAGVMPVVLAVLMLFALPGGPPAPEGPATPAALAMSKDGDRVILTIANGGRAHRVTKSSVPHDFEGSAGVVVSDGSFVDRVEEGDAPLVFYRVE